ncbi:MAG: adenylyltransferase/cytidyltransferase family protein [Anaplasma sp.]
MILNRLITRYRRRYVTTVGVFGGSFDPPHKGHVHVADKLQKLLQLDEVWWVISANLQKPKSKYCSTERLSMVESVIFRHWRMRAMLASSTYSYDVVRGLKCRYPHVRFVWIAGSDIISTMHLWHRWRDFCALLPMVFLERRGMYGMLRMPFAAAMAMEYYSDLKFLLNRSRGWSLVRSGVCAISSTEVKDKSDSPNA